MRSKLSSDMYADDEVEQCEISSAFSFEKKTFFELRLREGGPEAKPEQRERGLTTTVALSQRHVVV